MAVLLAQFIVRDGAAAQSAWRAMRARAQARACDGGDERCGPGWRAWAGRTLPHEPAPLVDLDAGALGRGTTLLLDRAIGDHDPTDRARGDWTAGQLLDGTASASIRIDAAGRLVELARDVMGQRALVWARTPAALVVASGEDILLADPAVARDFDLDWFAALLAGVSPGDDSSAYRAIRTLPTGSRANFVDGKPVMQREALAPDASVAEMTDAEVLERFGALVDRAVQRSLRGVARPAISLSGGLDSVLVAESTARQWRRGARPLAVAFGFDRWPGIDERSIANAVATHLDFEFRAFAADDLVPMRAGLDRPVCPDTPYATPYREIKEAAYRLVAASGCDALLSGNFGDHLYAHPARWLVDAVRHGRLDLVRSAWAAGGFDGALLDPGVRILARPWLLRWPRPPRGLTRLAAPWRERLGEVWRRGFAAHAGWPRPTQAMLCFDAAAAFDAHGEDWFAARHRLAFRQPLRDPDLTRFMLSLPAFQSTRGATGKWLARAWLRGRLPDAVVDRPKGGDLTPFAEAADRTERPNLLSRAAEARSLLEPMLSNAARCELDDGDRPWLLACVAAWLIAAGHRDSTCSGRRRW